jgi:hypothetical protein
LIGSRGFMIAIIGSVLPIGLGIVIALALGSEPLEAIAAGATFSFAATTPWRTVLPWARPFWIYATKRSP